MTRIMLISTLGQTEIYAWTTDGVEYSSPESNEDVLFDNISPTITKAEIVGTAGENGWITSTGQINITAEDNVEGIIAGYTYEVYNLQNVLQKKSDGIVKINTPITIETDGMWKIAITAVDKAGNTSSPKLVEVYKDTVKPTVGAPVVENILERSFRIRVSAGDETSGVARYEYWINGSKHGENNTGVYDANTGLNPNGTYSIVVKVYDNAGLSQDSIATPVVTKGELLKPNANISGDTRNGYYVGNVNIQVTDASSSATTRAVRIGYTINNVQQTPIYAASGNIQITQDGVYNISVWEEDNQGNRSEANTIATFSRDTTPPSIPNVVYNSGANTCNWKNNYNLTINSTDNLSGVAYYVVDYHGNGTDDRQVAENFVPENGYNSCTNIFKAVDNAGNVSTWTAQHHIHQDTQAPWVTNSWYGPVANGGVSLYIQVADNAAGIASVKAPTSTEAGGYNNWHWYETVWDAGANAWRADITGATYGQYNTWFYTHIYPYDHAGNTACYPKDDQKVYIPNPNTAPVIQSAVFSSMTPTSLTCPASATDAATYPLT